MLNRRPPALLRSLRHLLQVGGVAQMHRGVRLERGGQTELLADLAHRRHDLLAEEADASPRIFSANRGVIAPYAVNARPGLFEHAAQFRDDRLWRAEEDAPIGNLLLKSRAPARVLGAPDRELDEVAAQRGREIARRVRPHRVR